MAKKKKDKRKLYGAAESKNKRLGFSPTMSKRKKKLLSIFKTSRNRHRADSLLPPLLRRRRRAPGDPLPPRERRDHPQGGGGLVHRDHVPGPEHTHEAEVEPVALDLPRRGGRGAAVPPTFGAVGALGGGVEAPVLEVGVLEVVAAGPGEGEDPAQVAKLVAVFFFEFFRRFLALFLNCFS